MLYATKGRGSNVRLLTPKDLELLAVSFYERLSYKKVRYSGQHVSTDGGVDVWLTTRDADVEIVQCKQLSAKVTREHVKEFVKTMRKVGAIKGHYWAPAGFSKPAIEYVENIDKSVTLYDAEFIVREVHEFFYDEVRLARDKLIAQIKEQGFSGEVKIPADKKTYVVEHPVYRQPPPKKKRKWTVAQVTIMFGMGLVACSLVYCLLVTLATGGGN